VRILWFGMEYWRGLWEGGWETEGVGIVAWYALSVDFRVDVRALVDLGPPLPPVHPCASFPAAQELLRAHPDLRSEVQWMLEAAEACGSPLRVVHRCVHE
jgi:hypothetical protein